MATRPVTEGLFERADESETGDIALIAGRCESCGALQFPKPPFCPSCGDDSVATHHLGTEGTLWTFTTQEFLPKNPPYLGTEGPADFEPFAVGYVELPDELRIETRLTDVAFDELTIGMPMTLTAVPFATDEDGTEVLTFAFRPAATDPRQN